MKRDHHKKLRLQYETIRTLTPTELGRAAGGTATTAPFCSDYCSGKCAPTTTAPTCGDTTTIITTTAPTCTEGGPPTTAIFCR